MHNRSLYHVLTRARSTGSPALMVDVKCCSPRDGELISADRLEPFVRAVVDGGADALSTPTDPVYFGGSLDTARKIRQLSPLPLMRKSSSTRSSRWTSHWTPGSTRCSWR